MSVSDYCTLPNLKWWKGMDAGIFLTTLKELDQKISSTNLVFTHVLLQGQEPIARLALVECVIDDSSPFVRQLGVHTIAYVRWLNDEVSPMTYMAFNDSHKYTVRVHSY